MSGPTAKVILVILALALAAGIGPMARHLGEREANRPSGEPDPKAPSPPVVPAIAPGEFVRLDPDRPEPWQAHFDDPPQPPGDFRQTAPPRPSGRRRVLVLQPLGAFDDEEARLLEPLREFAEAFFQMPVRLEPAMELPATPDWRRTQRLGREREITQYNADRILSEVLAERMPEDAVACLGVTMSDLWSGDLNFVFGLGSNRPQVGVFSLCRYFPEFRGQARQAGDEALILLRGCKVLSHEGGHALGLLHCGYYRCGMNGSSNLRERDATPIHFCPVCLEKLTWYLGCDVDRRYRDLHRFYERGGLPEQAAWVAARRQRLQSGEAE
jgi:archaemetzincin